MVRFGTDSNYHIFFFNDIYNKILPSQPLYSSHPNIVEHLMTIMQYTKYRFGFTTGLVVLRRWVAKFSYTRTMILLRRHVISGKFFQKDFLKYSLDFRRSYQSSIKQIQFNPKGSSQKLYMTKNCYLQLLL